MSTRSCDAPVANRFRVCVRALLTGTLAVLMFTGCASTESENGDLKSAAENPVSGQKQVTVVIPKTAEYLNSDDVADNIKTECNLPAKQTQFLKEFLVDSGFEVQVAETADIPKTGVYLKINIINAISMGNAFVGHKKHVSVLAVLYVEGAEVAKTTMTRDSMGGFGAGFKGSCAVLERCCNALGKDVAVWLKTELPKHTATNDK